MFLDIVLMCYLNGIIAGVVSCNFCLFVLVVVFLHTVLIGLALLFCSFRKAKQKTKTHPYNHDK